MDESEILVEEFGHEEEGEEEEEGEGGGEESVFCTRFSDNYLLKEEIGRGLFAVVRRCVFRCTGQEFAVKVVNSRKMEERERRIQELSQQFYTPRRPPWFLEGFHFQGLEREAHIWRKLNHKNILKFQDSAQEEKYYLVYELARGGPLLEELARRENYTEAEVAGVMVQLFRALSHCHRIGIIHRDIKPEVLFLSEKSSNNGVGGWRATLKLSDFRLALEVRGDERRWSGFAGTPGYVSPEVLNREPYGKPVDLWAAGVILYILLVGYPPFADPEQHRLYAKIRAGWYELPDEDWLGVSSEAKDLLRQLLNPEQARRPTAEDVLRHPWFASDLQQSLSQRYLDAALTKLRSFNIASKETAQMGPPIRRFSQVSDNLEDMSFEQQERSGKDTQDTFDIRASATSESTRSSSVGDDN